MRINGLMFLGGGVLLLRNNISPLLLNYSPPPGEFIK